MNASQPGVERSLCVEALILLGKSIEADVGPETSSKEPKWNPTVSILGSRARKHRVARAPEAEPQRKGALAESFDKTLAANALDDALQTVGWTPARVHIVNALIAMQVDLEWRLSNGHRWEAFKPGTCAVRDDAYYRVAGKSEASMILTTLEDTDKPGWFREPVVMWWTPEEAKKFRGALYRDRGYTQEARMVGFIDGQEVGEDSPHWQDWRDCEYCIPAIGTSSDKWEWKPCTMAHQ